MRIDSGVRQGGAVTPYYDPMIAKVIAHGPDRRAACQRLADALGKVRVEGVTANAGFLRRIVTHPAFLDGGVTTKFLEAEGAGVTDAPGVPPRLAALATLWRHLSGGEGFRLNLPRTVHARFERGGVSLSEGEGGDWSGEALGEAVTLSRVRVTDRGAAAMADGARIEAHVRAGEGTLTVAEDGERFVLRLIDPMAQAGGAGGDAAGLLSPMPATVTGVMVAEGDRVEAGQPLVTIEAMKMEHVIKAPSGGTITGLPYAKGDSVKEGAALVGFEAA